MGVHGPTRMMPGGGGGSALLDRNVEKLLSEPWGAAQAGALYNREVLGSLCEQFSRLEPQARRGALQGTLFMRKGQKADLQAEVRSLVDLGTADKDQWVSLIARALGGLKERFDLHQLQQDVPAVAEALASIRDKIQVDGTPDTYRPLEEMYLSPRCLAAAGAPPCEGSGSHGHFTLRGRREPKKRLAGGVQSSNSIGNGFKASGVGGSSGSHPGAMALGSNNSGAGASFLSGQTSSAQQLRRGPMGAPSAPASMFAPPSRKPAASTSFLRDSGPVKRPTSGLLAGGAKAFLAARKGGDSGGTKTMMIDVSEAAQLGTAGLAEDLQKEERQREQKERQEAALLKRKQEAEDKQRRIHKMMEERELKKVEQEDRKRVREEEANKRKAEVVAKRVRMDGVSTPSPTEQEPVFAPHDEPMQGY